MLNTIIKKKFFSIISTIVSIFFFLVIFKTSAFAEIYYVDATGGLDTNTGIAIDQAWQTISKINSSSFVSGDSVLFKRGEIWTMGASDTILGTSGVTYSAYGTGDLPIIDGDNVAEVFISNGKTEIVLNSLDLRNGLNANAQFIESSFIEVINCEMSGAGNDNLIFITNNTNVTVTGGVYFNPVRRVAGTFVSNIELADGGSNFTISDVELYGAENAGITIHNHSQTDPQGKTDMPTNITIENINSHDNAGYGINVMTQDVTEEVALSVTNSSFNTNNTGIRIQKTTPSTGYVHGSLLFDQNTIANNTAYAYYIEGDDVTIQRSLVYGTAWQGRVISSKNFNLYNNTFSLTPSSALWMLYIMGGTRVDGINVINNIFYMGNTSGMFVGSAASSNTNLVIDYNEYYFSPYTGNARWMNGGTSYSFANWVSVVENDVNGLGPTSNPLFTDASTYDFTLQTDSPAINTGVDVGLIYNGVAPDLGAYEYAYGPSNPAALSQYKADGITSISVGTETNETSVVLKFAMSSVNGEDSLTPQVEIKQVGTDFTNTPTDTGTAQDFSGTPVIGSVTITGLEDEQSYHWQARVVNSQGSSEWVTTGELTDFTINLDDPPPLPPEEEPEDEPEEEPEEELEEEEVKVSTQTITRTIVLDIVKEEEIDEDVQENSQPSYTIRIMVKDEKGDPVLGAKVTLLPNIQTKYSDSNGEVEFTQLTQGEYTVEVEYDGYKGQKDLIIGEDQNDYIVTIILEMSNIQDIEKMNSLSVWKAILIILGIISVFIFSIFIFNRIKNAKI